MAIIGCLLSPALSLNAAREFKPGEILHGFKDIKLYNYEVFICFDNNCFCKLVC